MHVVTIIHYQSVTELGLVFHNSYSNFTNFPSIFSPFLNVSVSANKIEVCAKISIIDIRRFIYLFPDFSKLFFNSSNSFLKADI